MKRSIRKIAAVIMVMVLTAGALASCDRTPPYEERPVIRIVTPEKEEETPMSSSTEFDLPKLKEEDGFSFDQIEGEEYNINK